MEMSAKGWALRLFELVCTSFCVCYIYWVSGLHPVLIKRNCLGLVCCPSLLVRLNSAHVVEGLQLDPDRNLKLPTPSLWTCAKMIHPSWSQSGWKWWRSHDYQGLMIALMIDDEYEWLINRIDHPRSDDDQPFNDGISVLASWWSRPRSSSSSSGSSASHWTQLGLDQRWVW